MPPYGTSCVEGLYRFNFEAGYDVCRFECSPFYAHHAQNFCNSCKEMDFVLYHPHKKELWLIEVKDYRFNARPKVADLVEKLCRKVKDSLFLLRTAALCAPEESPAEGVPLRDIARMSLQAKRIRIAFTIELGRTGLFPPKSLLATVKDLLYRQIRFIDPDMLCVPISESGGAGPWTISPAGGEHSARIQRRMEEARLAREKESKLAEEHARRQQKLDRKRQRKLSRQQGKLPLWKQRAQEREAGQTGTHADRCHHPPVSQTQQKNAPT